MLELRPYQSNLVEEIAGAMRHHRSNLLRLPTGGGKTAIATKVTERSVMKGNTIHFIVHRQELLEQTAKTFKKANLDYISFIANGWFHDPRCPIQICSIGTLCSRLSKTQIPRLAIWDEAHHLGAKGWQAVKNAYCSSYHLGLSATPERLDGKGLKPHFSNMILGPTEEWLIQNKFLSEFTVYAPGVPDLTATHTRMGDYVQAELNAAMDKSKITGDIIAHWKKLAQGKRTILFAVSVAHSMHMVEQFNAAGVRAVHLDGGSKPEERRRVALAFAEGYIDVLSNVELFGEGYDLSAQADRDVTVDCVIQARPTQSMAMHRQQVGRALRPKADGSKAVILDHAGNVMRHGLPDELYDWSLDGRQKDDKPKEKTLAMRICPECKGAHRVAPRCPYCKFQYPIAAREVVHEEGELKEVDKETLKLQRKQEMKKSKTLDELVAYGRRQGYKNPEGWAAHVFTARQAKQKKILAERYGIQ